MHSKKLVAALAVTVAAAGGTAATQVAGATPDRPAAATLHLSDAKNKLAFSVKTLRAKHGKITLRMTNPSGLMHAIAVNGHSGRTVGKGGVSTVTLTLKKGRYTFFCPVPGHRAAGMKGTLIVS